jgi:Uncharacterized protein predicted to be involved in DNA repair (RAMP superfamily)
MKTYKVTLRSTGFLTKIPDSQQLFGALIYRYNEVDQENASLLVEKIWRKEAHLALSNVLPSGYLPTPHDYLEEITMDKEDGVDKKTIHKAIKKRSYILVNDLVRILSGDTSSDELRKALSNNSSSGILKHYVKLVDRQQLRASIDSMRYDIFSLDSRLYSVPYVIPLTERDNPVTEYNFYLQIQEEDIFSRLIETLECDITNRRKLILGKRASQGLNTFQLEGMELVSLPYSQQQTRFLNTGMLLPDQIDYNYSKLKLFISERRPYEIAGGWPGNFNSKFISFIEEGSIIFFVDGLCKASKSIKPDINDKRIVFGNAFLYPVAVGGRKKYEKV